MRGSYEKTDFEQNFPFRLFFDGGYSIVPHHWHEEIEIIYLVEGTSKIGIGNDVYNLQVRDILIIGAGEIHWFYKDLNSNKRAVIQFRMSVYDTFLSVTRDKKTIKPMFTRSLHLTVGTEIHDLMEKQIKELIRENMEAKEGYKLILKARLYDLAGILIRHLPREAYSIDAEDTQFQKLQKLDKVFKYVEENYGEVIPLDQISSVAGFSKYYFTRFFKDNTGVTFIDYLNNVRISKAEWHLAEGNDPIIEVAYKAGFNSVKTFNRVFRQLKGCAPMEYKRLIKKNNTEVYF